MSEDWADAFLDWLAKEKKYSYHTVRSYQTDLNKFKEFLGVQFETQSMLEVGKPEVRTWVMSMLNNGLAESTVNRKLVTLSSYYNYALKNEWIEKNPIDLIARPKQPKRLASFVEETTIQKVLDKTNYSKDFSGVRARMVMQLLYSCGLRVSELTSLIVSDFDKARMELRVLGKGNKERFIPIGVELLNTFNEYLNARNSGLNKLNHNHLIVTDKGAEAYPMLISRIVNSVLLGYANVSQTNPHILRHTFATHLLNNGSDINAIKELLGHSSLASTAVYTHNSISRLKDVYKKSHPRK